MNRTCWRNTTCSDIQPDTIHGDTHSQSATVFGLADLLGISLMPRIRGWQKLTFYHPHSTAHYQHIDNLFTDTVNWQLNERPCRKRTGYQTALF